MAIDASILFTDIEGSTRLLQRLGESYRQVLDDHFVLLGSAVTDHGGTIANRMGDGLMALFPTALQALQAAVQAQQTLAAHPWPPMGIVLVRMGIHSGSITETSVGHLGLDVHRAARICSAAHGGQILASHATVSPLTTARADTVSFIDLGRHHLKDLDQAEHLIQVSVTGLLSEFPPPRSTLMRPHNLPSEATAFVGRRREVETVERLLKDARLLTLTGPGGCGKTRLALRIASRVLADFDDGVFFVPLATARDIDQALALVARAIGASEQAGRPTLEILIEYLRSKQQLLILDNFEQILAASDAVSDLIAGAPGLKVMVTSRARLRISGEHIFQVEPFVVPDLDDVGDLAKLAAMEGVDLFVRRLRAIQPGFELSGRNADAVARIVARLEGLPLAIELAAARGRLFPPELLIGRLDKPLTVLSVGSGDKDGHHRTLREAIAWSYSLLDDAEQVAFRRLGVFHGGFTIEAAEAVAAGEPVVDVLDAVSSLLDKSLVRSLALHGEARLTMLETIREFALEELGAAGELLATQACHSNHFLEFAEEMEPFLTGPAEAATVDRLSADHANIQAALRHCLETGDVDAGLRIAGAIWRFWHATGQSQQGRKWLQTFLAETARAPAVRAKGLLGLAGLSYWQADYQTALTSYDEALELYRGLGERLMEADTLLSLSTTLTWSGNAEKGGHLADQALKIFHELGAREKIGMVCMAQGFARWMQNDLEGARPLWEESLAIAREVGDMVEVATKTLALASITFRQGREAEALQDSLKALDDLVELKNVSLTVMAIDWVAALAAARDPERSVELAGAADTLRRRLGGGMRPESSGLESARTIAGRKLSPSILERAWIAGTETRLADAVELARKVAIASLQKQQDQLTH